MHRICTLTLCLNLSPSIYLSSLAMSSSSHRSEVSALKTRHPLPHIYIFYLTQHLNKSSDSGFSFLQTAPGYIVEDCLTLDAVMTHVSKYCPASMFGLSLVER